MNAGSRRAPARRSGGAARRRTRARTASQTSRGATFASKLRKPRAPAARAAASSAVIPTRTSTARCELPDERVQRLRTGIGDVQHTNVRVLVEELFNEPDRELVPGEHRVARQVHVAVHRFDHRSEVRVQLVGPGPHRTEPRSEHLYRVDARPPRRRRRAHGSQPSTRPDRCRRRQRAPNRASSSAAIRYTAHRLGRRQQIALAAPLARDVHADAAGAEIPQVRPQQRRRRPHRRHRRA